MFAFWSLDLVIVAAVEEELGARGLVDERGDEGPHDGENAGRADDQNPVSQTVLIKSGFDVYSCVRSVRWSIRL